MLWLAGLMGLMAVGAVTFVDPQLNEDDEDNFDSRPTPTPSSNEAPDNFEPDYDPRGGDDAALLPPLVLSTADSVVLTEGSNEGDQFDGDDNNDRSRGQGGDDTLNGGDGNDELRGDDGDDILGGDAGNDTLHGNDGGDLLRGGDQNDALFGHNSDDMLFGDAGNDSLQGSAGNDMLEGGEADDTLHGGLDDDTLTGGAGADVLFGGWGNDVMSGLMRDAAGTDTDDADFLNGGGGDDSILAGSGDIITAGEGADEIVLGDWLTSGEAAQIMDYAAEDDSLVLVWDDSGDTSVEPQITLGPDPDVDNQTLVMLDGTLVATVNGSTLLPSDIALVPLSSATQLGLTAS